MIDFRIDDNGDLMIDPDTHDFAMVDGVDEVAQRIRTTLNTRYGEMTNLDPTMGTDYRSFLGKKFNMNNAVTDMTNNIKNNVPEVETISDFEFKKLPQRRMEVSFKAVVKVVGNDTTDEIKEVFNFGEQ